MDCIYSLYSECGCKDKYKVWILQDKSQYLVSFNIEIRRIMPKMQNSGHDEWLFLVFVSILLYVHIINDNARYHDTRDMMFRVS